MPNGFVWFHKKDFGKLEQLLAPDVEFKCPAMKLSGAQNYVTASRRVGTVLLRNEMKKTFIDGNEVCVIYEFVTDTNVGAVPTVEWLRIEDERIRSVWLLYDRQPWPAVMEESARRAVRGPPRNRSRNCGTTP